MKLEDYPALFQTSDAAALASEGATMRMLRLQLGLTVIASLCGGLTLYSSSILSKMLATIAALALMYNIVLIWILRAKRYERAWFECRAIAESIKSLTWQYMMGVSSFELSRTSKEIDQSFVKNLRDVFEAQKGSAEQLAGHQVDGEAITQAMREMRALTTERRKNKYLQERLRDQKAWYQHKAIKNRRWETFRFSSVIVIQGLAIAVAVIIAIVGDISFNPVGVLTTLSASLIAWTQVKGQREVLVPYVMAADELSSLESLQFHVDDEASLSKFVEEVEEAISREHKMWHAKRMGTEFWSD